MKHIYRPMPEEKSWQFDTLAEDNPMPEGWTDVEPPQLNWKPIFNWETNEWVETATWFEKLGFESEEDAKLHIAQEELEATLPTTEERIAMLEEVVIFLTMEGLEG